MTMPTIEYTISAPIIDEADVLVVGGGPAGIAAAIASARTGADTILAERYGFLGGNLTAGLVGPCMTSYSLDGAEQLIKGIFEEFVVRMEQIGGAIHPSKIAGGSPYSGFFVFGHERVTPFEPEAAKRVAMEMCLEAGVRLALHTFAVDAIRDECTVSCVVFASKSGLEATRAAQIVDCSADGDVAARAGVPFEIGRAEDGLTQPMTLFFRVANVDDAGVDEYVASHPEEIRPYASLVDEARERGEFPPIPRRAVGIYRTTQAGVWRINTTRVLKRLGTDARDLTAAEIEGRRQAWMLVEFFRKWLPGFEDCRLLDTATTIGVRETRRIKGEYTLTLEDLQAATPFDDVIALCGYPVDIHSPVDGSGVTLVNHNTANAYEIPYRCLVPQGVNNLLVAGRCVSATHEAMAAIRVMPPAFAMGQAAGTAAALSMRAGVEPRALDVETLQAQLLADDAYLGPRVVASPLREPVK